MRFSIVFYFVKDELEKNKKLRNIVNKYVVQKSENEMLYSFIDA